MYSILYHKLYCIRNIGSKMDEKTSVKTTLFHKFKEPQSSTERGRIQFKMSWWSWWICWPWSTVTKPWCALFCTVLHLIWDHAGLLQDDQISGPGKRARIRKAAVLNVWNGKKAIRTKGELFFYNIVSAPARHQMDQQMYQISHYRRRRPLTDSLDTSHRSLQIQATVIHIQYINRGADWRRFHSACYSEATADFQYSWGFLTSSR